MPKMTLELTILTLNIWGIPYISSDRAARIQAIANELKKGLFDVVSLQEVWSKGDFEYLTGTTQDVYPYSHYFFSGVFGSGLCILSKHPIVQTLYHSWSVNGYAHRIQHGDWFGGKGVGLCRLLVGTNTVNIYIAHLHAEYDCDNDEYKAHRIIQAFDTAQFIETTRSDSILQILAGDLNIGPGDIAFGALMQVSNLKDACPDERLATNDCPTNSYTSPLLMRSDTIGKRIDHILYRAGRNHKAIVEEFFLPFPNRVPGQEFSFSDHEAVFAKIQVQSVSERKDTGDDYSCDEMCNPTHRIVALTESIDVCETRLVKLNHDRIFYMTMACLVGIVLLCLTDTQPYYGLNTFFLISKFLLSAVIVYFAFMGTIWNIMERHGILSGKLSMEIALKYAKMRSKDSVSNNSC